MYSILKILHLSISYYCCCYYISVVKVLIYTSSALDAESERVVQEALDKIIKGMSDTVRIIQS